MHVNIYKVPRLQLIAVSKVNSLTRFLFQKKELTCCFSVASFN